MTKARLLFILFLTVFILLISLGTWQVKRLIWKEALIARIETITKQAPMELGHAVQEGRNLEYYPVWVHGRFLHDKARHVYALSQQGKPGWHIYTPMETEPGVIVFVNRGWIPLEGKARSHSGEKQGAQTISLKGLIRMPRNKRGLFIPDDRPLKNEWYWPSLSKMTKSIFEANEVQVTPFFIDQIREHQTGAFPVANTTIVKPANRHLGYVITWYGLALALLAVYGFFLVENRRKNKSVNGEST